MFMTCCVLSVFKGRIVDGSDLGRESDTAHDTIRSRSGADGDMVRQVSKGSDRYRNRDTDHDADPSHQRWARVAVGLPTTLPCIRLMDDGR